MNKLYLLTLSLIIAILFWSLGWKYLAWQIDGRIDQQLARLAERGNHIECSDKYVGGYPFNIAVFCDQPVIRHKNLIAKLQAFKINALVYNYNKIVLQADSPLQVEDQTSGMKWQVSWDTHKANLMINDNDLDQTNHQFEQLTLKVPSLDEDAFFETRQLNVSVINQDNGSVKFGMVAQEGTLPLVNIDVSDLQCIGNISRHQASFASFLPDWKAWQRLQGRILLEKCAIRSDDKAIHLTGSAMLRSNGHIDAKFPIRVENLKALSKQFKPLQLLGHMLKGPRDYNGVPVHEGTFEIKQGRLKFGFIELGILKPLF